MTFYWSPELQDTPAYFDLGYRNDPAAIVIRILDPRFLEEDNLRIKPEVLQHRASGLKLSGEMACYEAALCPGAHFGFGGAFAVEQAENSVDLVGLLPAMNEQNAYALGGSLMTLFDLLWFFHTNHGPSQSNLLQFAHVTSAIDRGQSGGAAFTAEVAPVLVSWLAENRETTKRVAKEAMASAHQAIFNRTPDYLDVRVDITEAGSPCLVAGSGCICFGPDGTERNVLVTHNVDTVWYQLKLLASFAAIWQAARAHLCAK